ncbi:MAG TPA: putative protein N(5)-glutamine methyltransferase [Candidatus Solibacter sp.]|nr:putative protein N(5)-glutamine methyltransferase [Candidatus Solibacter sp.]
MTNRLRAAGCVFAEDEAELLVAAARTPAELDEMVALRVAGLPLEQVLGWADFCGIRVAIDPGVFVPRWRTEFLVRHAASLAPPGAVVVDMCCGSGALGVALAASVDRIELHAADIDPVSVGCARRNVGPIGGSVYEGNLFDALPACLRGRVDILMANTPYVPTEEIGMLPREARIYEPRAALDGGPDGLDVVRLVASAAPDWLASGGHLFIETSRRQAPMAASVFAAAGLLPRVATSEEFDATVVIGDKRELP